MPFFTNSMVGGMLGSDAQGIHRCNSFNELLIALFNGFSSPNWGGLRIKRGVSMTGSIKLLHYFSEPQD
jgi:hypothetical protein